VHSEPGNPGYRVVRTRGVKFPFFVVVVQDSSWLSRFMSKLRKRLWNPSQNLEVGDLEQCIMTTTLERATTAA
jgi:hypothetical protein